MPRGASTQEKLLKAGIDLFHKYGYNGTSVQDIVRAAKVQLSNQRGPDSLREIIDHLGPRAQAATKEEAASCEMVLLAVPWDDVPATLASLPKWKNQILIDGTNPFSRQGREI